MTAGHPTLKELKRIKALQFRLRTAQELSKVNQGRQNKSMLVEKVSERYWSFFVKLNIVALQLLMLGCTEVESVAGADEVVHSLS